MGVTEEMVGWYHWLNGQEFEQALGDGEGQGSLACCSPWGRKDLDTSEQLNNKEWKMKSPAQGPGLVSSWEKLEARCPASRIMQSPGIRELLFASYWPIPQCPPRMWAAWAKPGLSCLLVCSLSLKDSRDWELEGLASKRGLAPDCQERWGSPQAEVPEKKPQRDRKGDLSIRISGSIQWRLLLALVISIGPEKPRLVSPAGVIALKTLRTCSHDGRRSESFKKEIC